MDGITNVSPSPGLQPLRAGWRSWNLSLDRAELHQPRGLRWEHEGKTRDEHSDSEFPVLDQERAPRRSARFCLKS